MSLHLQAKPGEIAESVIISGDPLRAKFLAHKYLSDVVCYNELRGMFGFTGLYKEKRISLQGTGIGIPSTAIYLHELIHEYGVKRIIRLGTCGAIRPNLQLGDIIVTEKAYTDSYAHLLYHDQMDEASLASGTLLQKAINTAASQSLEIHVGSVFSTDVFYSDPDRWIPWTERGLLAVDMETSFVYAIAEKNNIEALSVLLVSDNIITRDVAPVKEREQIDDFIAKLCLEIA